MELFASAPGLAVEESYVRLLNHLPGLAYRCRVGRTAGTCMTVLSRTSPIR